MGPSSVVYSFLVRMTFSQLAALIHLYVVVRVSLSENHVFPARALKALVLNLILSAATMCPETEELVKWNP